MPALQNSTAGRLRLSGNALKVIAAIAMTLDHIGLLFFPTVAAFRAIGRLAMPIFAFMIAEGCRYTRSMARYFLSVFALAAVCQSAYVIAENSWYLCMPVSFSLSIVLVFLLQRTAHGSRLWGLVFLAATAGVYVLTGFVSLDYGFLGCLLPVLAYLPMLGNNKNIHWSVLTLGIGLIPLALEMGTWQFWSLLSIPVLLLYSGKRGKLRMKYFFYLFYPGHLAALQVISWLLYA